VGNRDHLIKKLKSLRRDLPIITTPHAKSHLANKAGENEVFTAVYELDTFDSMFLEVQPTAREAFKDAGRLKAVKVTAMPGKHVPPGVLGTLNDLVGAVCLFVVSNTLGI
jgi:hypothetical protein